MADFDFGRAYLTGVSIRRQQEETRALIMDRTEKEQAALKLAAMEQKIRDGFMQIQLQNESVKPIVEKMQMGEAVTTEEAMSLVTATSAPVSDALNLLTSVTMETMASGATNRHLMEGATQMYEMNAKSLMARMEMAERLHTQIAEDAKTDAYISAQRTQQTVALGQLSLARNEDQRMAGREPLVREEIAAGIRSRDAATRASDQQVDYYAQETQQSGEMFPIEKGRAEAGLKQDRAQAARAVRTEHRDARLDALKEFGEMASFVAAADKNGWDEDVISRYLPPDISPGMLRNAKNNMDEELEPVIGDLTARRDRAEQAYKDGITEDTDEIDMLNKEITRVRLMADSEKNAQLRWENLVRDEGALGAFAERMKLVAQRRKLGVLASSLAGPMGSFAYIMQSDPAELMAEDPGWVDLFGRSGKKERGAKRPSEVPSTAESINRGVERTP